jgi:hypothetical protein
VIPNATERYQAWYSPFMWPVKYLLAAAKERDQLPTGERQAIYNVVRKLEVLGPQLPSPHSSDARNAPGLRELRPRGGNCPWRPLYCRDGDSFLIAAIAPDGLSNRRGFAAACKRALQRLEERERELEEE